MTAASTTPVTHVQTETGGNSRANTCRACGTASSSTRTSAIAATRAMALPMGRQATSASTHRPTANTASMAAVRAATVLTPGVARAIA